MRNIIPHNIQVQYKINGDCEVIEKIIDPIELLCANRLDIAAKVWYLHMRDNMQTYAADVYVEHIRAMTKGSFIEAYGEKSNSNSFIESFERLYNSIKSVGFDVGNPIPVDRNMQILDGAHRVAIGLVLGIKVPIIILPIDAVDKYDANFFERQGVSNELIDIFVQQYIKISKNVVCINIWPSAQGHDEELETLIGRYFEVVYKKNVQLNENGAFYYLIQIYKEYSWAQNDTNGFSEVYRKLLPCFPNFSPIRTMFVDKKSDIDLVKVKTEMRSLFNLGKHSLHITDNQIETIEMANIVLNDNSINFINQANPLLFKNTFLQVKEVVEKYKNNLNVIFTGSMVLALYGIREANDIDYLTYEKNDECSHNYLIKKYQISLNDLLFNEKYRFYFFNCPFVTLDVIKKFKKNRNEGKDKDDLILIEKVLSHNPQKSKLIKFLRWKRRIIAKAQGIIIIWSHKTGTYELLRGIYKKYCG